MSIGLCCQYIEPVIKRTGNVFYKNIIGEKRLQFTKYCNNQYSLLDIEKIWINNIKGLSFILKKIQTEGYKSFRVSSGLFPLHDKENNLLLNSSVVKEYLFKIGNFVKEYNIRLTTHPDQFVVLSSNNDDVIKNSILLLEHHNWIFNQMGLDETPFYAINVHGGTKGNIDKLLHSINRLSSSMQKRLTLENDERSYSVNDLLPAFNNYGVPICFDSHHHFFNDCELSIDDALQICKTTWGNIKPLTHLSNTTPGLEHGSFTEKRKHSDFVHYIPECQRIANNNNEIDIDFEFKMKNIAIQKALQEFDILL